MLITLFIITTLFLVGICLGSFLNVVIYRSTRGESWVGGRSHCESCRRTIYWYDNIPLLSFLFLGGKCRFCSTPLSLSHPIVEGITGLLFIWWYLVGFFFFQLSQQPFTFLQPLFWLIVGIILLFIFIIDYRYLIISDTAVFVLSALVILYRFTLVFSHIMQLHDFIFAIIGMASSVLFFWLLWFFTQGKGMGFGDVKLAIPLSLLVGWPDIFVWLLASFVSGAVVGVALLATGKAHLGKPIPFGPFLILGALVALIWGNTIIGWYATLIS